MTVFGQWKLKREGSDYLPGADKIHGTPLVMRLTSNDGEFYKITSKKAFGVEEIVVSYVSEKSIHLTSIFSVKFINWSTQLGFRI